eukprot:Em0001g1087a
MASPTTGRLDHFSEDKAELQILTRKPVCFVIFGKPGSGKTTLAKRLAAVWKCQLVDGTTTIEQSIRDSTPLGLQAKQRLLKGDELDDAFVGQLIAEKLASPEIKHYGYVLDCLPCASQVWKSTEDQLNFIRGLELTPDVIVNLKIPDSDLLKRRVGQKVDPISNEVLTMSVYKAKDKDKRGGAGDKEEGEKEDEKDEEDNDENAEEEKEADKDEYADDLGDLESVNHLATDICGRLVQRFQDLPQQAEQQISTYKTKLLRAVENFIIEHDQQFVIELDANLRPHMLFRSLLVRLAGLGLPRAFGPIRLLVSEDEEEADGVDTEEILTKLAETGTLMPQFRWKRSQWSRYCPVELTKGNMVLGSMKLAVAFLDKMYCLSSPEALTEFTRNPRPFILPPYPRIPCKICIVGPPSSGKSTLATMLAKKYNAMVVNLPELLKPIKERALEIAVKEARQDAVVNALSAITAQLAAQHSQGRLDTSPPPDASSVGEDHPDVKKAMDLAESRVRSLPINITQEMFLEAFRTGVQMAEKQRQSLSDERKFGGWIVDGFPVIRDQWSTMIDNQLLPDFVISLEEEASQGDLLLRRFTQQHGLPDPSLYKAPVQSEGALNGASAAEGNQQPAVEEKPSVPIPKEVEEWKKQKAEYDRQWGPLSSSMKGSAIDPFTLKCNGSPENLLQASIRAMEGVIGFKVTDFSIEDDEADDDPVLDTEAAQDEENEESKLKRKPWGDSGRFCPVALKESGVLWPGRRDIAVKYREKLYCFSSQANKEMFEKNPTVYTAGDSPLQLPPIRLFLLGAKGSGKTTLGRQLAEKLGIFHISFREYLQNQILSKMKKPPLVDGDDWENNEEPAEAAAEEGVEEKKEGDELDADVKVPLDSDEAAIRSYLMHGDPLQEGTIEKFTLQFWKDEPYKSTGFILEGFPSNGDELQLLCNKGLFPDAAVFLHVESKHIVERMLPGKMEIWKRKRNKLLEKKALAKEKKIKEWEADKLSRRTEITKDYEKKLAEKAAHKEKDEEDAEDEEEEEDSSLEEYKERLAEIDAEEMPAEDEEEEGESEADAKERLRAAITEAYEQQTESLSSLKDVFSELMIDHRMVEAGRKVSVVMYSLCHTLSRYTTERNGMLAKCTPLNGEVAKKLLVSGYKLASRFHKWCPVKLCDEDQTTLPPDLILKQQCPVIYQKRIYYLSSPAARDNFVSDPERYIRQRPPGSLIPIRLAIMGPPKSGKTTVANRFVTEYGCLRLSIGEAIRRVMAQFPESDLTTEMKSFLQLGQTLPDELCILALERALMDIQCTTRGYVLDGWPVTKSQVELLTRYRIVPVCIVELTVSDAEVLRRGDGDRTSSSRKHPMHDSPAILLTRSGQYYKHREGIYQWYSQQHDNWNTVDGERSQWWVWNEVRNKAASISGLCITPAEFKSRLGEYQEYCPVSLALKDELVNCSQEPSLKFSAEYKGKYYKMATEEYFIEFLSNPDKYIHPNAPRILPPAELLPQRISQSDVRAMFPKSFEVRGFCPVTYVDGNKRYEFLVPGNPELVAKYNNKIYCFVSEQKLEKFLRHPHHYELTTLPMKLPPLKQTIPVTSLPMLGYLEQSVATAVINGLSAVGYFKPKYPFLTAKASALVYFAYHLKAYNEKSGSYIRNKYKKKLAHFEEHCQLIGYLSAIMQAGYTEPVNRPLDFAHKMDSFLKLDKLEILKT